MKLIVDFITRLTSRKFMTAVGAYVLVLLDDLGVAEFSDEVLAAATGSLLLYLAVQGAIDHKNGG